MPQLKVGYNGYHRIPPQPQLASAQAATRTTGTVPVTASDLALPTSLILLSCNSAATYNTLDATGFNPAMCWVAPSAPPPPMPHVHHANQARRR